MLQPLPLLTDLQTTATELLDIVDDHDQVIGSATRGEVHRRGLQHRSVHVLVHNGDDSVLLQKRSMQKDQCAGMWDTSCAGHVEAGQEYSDTAPRELHEELGLTAHDALQPLFKMSPNPDNGHEFAMVYLLEHRGPFVAARDEIDELRWFSFPDVDQWADSISAAESSERPRKEQDLTSGFIEIWRRFRSPAEK